MAESGRPKKYLTIKHWEDFLNNHWRHMNWKVNGLVLGFIVMAGLLVAILCAILTVVYGG